jgi:hypothetical protein
MNQSIIYLFLLAGLGLALSSCGDTVTSTSSLGLSFEGLEDLGSDYVYEGWLIVDGNPITTGVFTINSDGSLSDNSFDIEEEDLEEASTFVLTIEPSDDSDPAPSNVHVLAGDFSGNSASLTVGHGAALGNDFSASEGKYILATPTDGADNNENSGIWFLDISSGMPAAGLDLPILPDGWVYEGWVVIDGVPVTTGTFSDIASMDGFNGFSSTMAGPPFPGEDFLQNAPSGLSFPTDLAGGTAVISVEPVPDNSANPFAIKPLVKGIPTDAVDHTVYDLDVNMNLPQGTASR